jgi:hypothetical protein
MGRPKIGSFSRENPREYRKQLRQEAVDYLGGKCSMCEITEDLEFDHLNVNDSEEDRKLRRNGKRDPKGQISSLWQLKNYHKDVRLLCKECHKKWSCAQRSAAYSLLASLPIEQQIELTNEYLQ